MVPAILENAAKKYGLSVVERGPGHYQILGGVLLVNYYPTSRRKSAYVEGTVKAHYGVTPKQAVQLAINPLPLAPKASRRRTGYLAEKRKLYLVSDICYRCGKGIYTFEEATLEHKVPLSKGGLDHINNMALSHDLCNKKAGNSMPRRK